MERKYLAHGDTGRDYVCFTFWSTHKANSAKNFYDANTEYKKRHGHLVKITSTQRIGDNDDFGC